MTNLQIAAEIVLIIFFLVNVAFWRFNNRNLKELQKMGKEIDRVMAEAQAKINEALKFGEK